jgi:riboflavin biosynthesis pyrimidine reductase
MIERRAPRKPVDAVLYGSDAEEWRPAGDAARVLVDGTGRIDAGAEFFRQGTAPVIVYSTGRKAEKAMAAMPHVRLHLRAGGAWPLCEVLEHLGATHGARRVGFAGGPELFRRLIVEGLLDELWLAWRPCILGGKAPAITGRDEHFLPRGVVLDLLKLERAEDECVARYRVRTAGSDE